MCLKIMALQRKASQKIKLKSIEFVIFSILFSIFSNHTILEVMQASEI